MRIKSVNDFSSATLFRGWFFSGENMDKVFNGSKQLHDDLKRFLTIEARTACQKAREDLLKEAKSQMSKFYAQYDPKIYKRSYETRDYSYEGVYRSHGESSVEGGIEIYWDKVMRGTWEKDFVTNKSKFTREEAESPKPVFVWQFGQHGYMRNPRISPSPLSQMEMFYNTYYDKWIEYGAKQAKKANYEMIGFNSAI